MGRLVDISTPKKDHQDARETLAKQLLLLHERSQTCNNSELVSITEAMERLAHHLLSFSFPSSE